MNCAEAYVEGLVNGKRVGNRLTFRFMSGVYSQGDVDSLAASVDGWYGTYMLANIPTEATYVNTHVRGLTSALDLEANNNDSAGAGGSGGENLTVNVSWVIKFTTGFTGRAARGRAYRWGLSATDLDANENNVSAAFAANEIGEWEQLQNEVNGAGWEHVLLHRISDGVALPTAQILVITGYTFTDLQVDTRRKRLG